MAKSPEMKRVLDSITAALFKGRTLSEAHETKTCVGCGKSVLKWSNVDPIGPDWNFRDNLSLREYRISGLCQECQDKAFADPDSDEE